MELTSKSRFIILGSDGLWDVITNAKAAKVAMAARHPQRACQDLMREVTRRGSSDDATVVVVQVAEVLDGIRSTSEAAVTLKQHAPVAAD